MRLPIKLKGAVTFPANVNGGTGISVDKENGTYTIALDYTDIQENGTFDPDAVQVAIWNPSTEEWARLSLADFLNGSISALTEPVVLPSYTVATLPAGSAGASVWCSNCRVFNGAGTQEGAGAGTGGLVTHNGTAWKIAGTNVTAVA